MKESARSTPDSSAMSDRNTLPITKATPDAPSRPELVEFGNFDADLGHAALKLTGKTQDGFRLFEHLFHRGESS